MKDAWYRDRRVTYKPPRQDAYERLQPQSGGGLRTLQSFRGKYRRDTGERDRQSGGLSQRRSRPRRARAFVEGTPHGSGKAERVRRLPRSKSREESLNCSPFALAASSVRFAPVLVWFSLLILAACGGKKTQVIVPPPPAIPQVQPGTESQRSAVPGQPPATEKSYQEERLAVPADAKVLFEETGLASWYGAPYHNRRGSNGEVYNMHAMTAAHRTLPLGSIVRVTNLKTGSTAMVRITDRGPFVEGRILDLSQAAAKAVDVYLPGVAKVKLEVLETPAALDTGGRWAVQIGSFSKEKGAKELADHLQRRYRTANVLKFGSPVGDWWVRVRVLNDERERAQSLAKETETPEGSVFLVRLD